ncbi:N-acetylmuramic acid 6-phosphate etherase [Aliiroseovarius sp.]|uniref:N-acetylmuramic acid 6-phosphate etherase n=1 Tax=Aliiroseovarius sp. TaxID=1872442 RepID=UPI003BAADDD4
MSTRTTEQLHEAAIGLDNRPIEEVAAILAQGQAAAAAAVAGARDAICAGATLMARTISEGGVLHYAAAGSSGLMAASDALELGGTFSISPAQIRIHMAGGMPTGVVMPGDTEDDTAGLQAGLAGLGPCDTVIAVSASGTTPYTLEALRLAQRAGAPVIAIANNAGAPLLEGADVAILLETPPEVISGSTRMGAGTAQKIALNMLSTLMAVRLGHVHDGMMVNLTADNAKLRERARGIVTQVASVDAAAAEAALAQTDGRVKPAILLAAGARDAQAATELLEETGGHIRPALARVAEQQTENQ